MRRVLTAVVIVTLVASGLLATMWSQQRRLIYFPSPGPVPSAAAVLPTGRDVVLDTEDGIRLGAWYFPGARGAVLVCNGNAGDRSMRAELAVALNRMGLSVLLFDYRGYGGNPGRPSEEGLAADARAAQAWLAAQPDVDRSGSRTSANPLARQWRSASRCSDRRQRWCCGHRSPRWPTSAPCTTRGCRSGGCCSTAIRRSTASASVRAPLLVIAGDRDDIVPLSLSRRLYDAAVEPKRFVLVPGAGHNDPELLDGRQMLDEIEGFLSSTGLT